MNQQCPTENETKPTRRKSFRPSGGSLLSCQSPVISPPSGCRGASEPRAPAAGPSIARASKSAGAKRSHGAPLDLRQSPKPADQIPKRTHRCASRQFSVFSYQTSRLDAAQLTEARPARPPDNQRNETKPPRPSATCAAPLASLRAFVPPCLRAFVPEPARLRRVPEPALFPLRATVPQPARSPGGLVYHSRGRSPRSSGSSSVCVSCGRSAIPGSSPAYST